MTTDCVESMGAEGDVRRARFAEWEDWYLG